MSIEFECSQCSKTLRVAASNAGKKCRCPSCNALLAIPLSSSLAASSNSLTQSNSGVSLFSGKTEIACPKCSTTLLYSPELEGTRGLCKGCGHIFTLSHDDQALEEESDTFPFQCPNCEFLFEGKPEMEGRKGKCTECQSVFVIEKLKTEKPKAAPTAKPAPSIAKSPVKTKPATAIPVAIPTAIPVAIPMAIPQSNRNHAMNEPGNASAWDAIDLNQAAWQAPGQAMQTPAYTTNPYSAGNYATTSSSRGRGYSGSQDIASIASWHRKLSMSVLGVILMIPVYVGLIASMFAVANPREGQVGPIHFVILGGLFIAALIMFVLGILLLISYIVLCTKLYDSGMAVVMILGYFVGGLVPFLPLIMLVVVASKAASILKSKGYTVGLLGVSSDQLR